MSMHVSAPLAVKVGTSPTFSTVMECENIKFSKISPRGVVSSPITACIDTNVHTIIGGILNLYNVLPVPSNLGKDVIRWWRDVEVHWDQVNARAIVIALCARSSTCNPDRCAYVPSRKIWAEPHIGSGCTNDCRQPLGLCLWQTEGLIPAFQLPYPLAGMVPVERGRSCPCHQYGCTGWPLLLGNVGCWVREKNNS